MVVVRDSVNIKLLFIIKCFNFIRQRIPEIDDGGMYATICA